LTGKNNGKLSTRSKHRLQNYRNSSHLRS